MFNNILCTVYEFSTKTFYRDLSGNEIAELSKDTFYGLKSLTRLDLSINKIRTFPIEAFTRVHNLNSLLVWFLL